MHVLKHTFNSSYSFIIQNLEKDFEGYTRDHDHHPIEFDGDKITLKLPENPVDNWKIKALSCPMVYLI